MHTIEIDFDVFKALTVRRDTAEVSHNDVLRQLLGLSKVKGVPVQGGSSAKEWIAKGVSFPEGTEFRARYKGQEFHARVHDGALLYNGQRFKSPSAAAIAITGNSVNGWKFWECRRPGERDWRLMFSLWKNQKST